MNNQFICSNDTKPAELYEKKRWWLGLTIGDILDKNADLYPDKEAVVAQNVRYTYRELRDLSDRLAFNLLASGLTPGDRVMLQLPNWAEFIIAHYGIQKAGLVMVLLTVNHTAREVSHLASLTEPKGWILPAAYRDIDYVTLVKEVEKQVPGLDIVIFAGKNTPDGYKTFNDLLQCDADPQTLSGTVENARPDPRAVCYLLPTGGTTNLPKCAVRTHNDYLCNVEYKSRAWDINTTDISLVGTTVGHNLALLVSISGPIFHGGKIVLLDSTKPQAFCEIAQAEKITCTSMVPTLISRIVAFDGLDNYDLTSLKKIYVGAANSPPELVTRTEERMGAMYINAFGMVEGACSQSRPSDPIEVRTNTIGRPVCPYDDFVTLDEKGNRTPRGKEGEMAAKGPGIFSGYYKNAHTNQASFTPDGYFRTGDLAVIDMDGRIRITGRIKDVINRGGEKISARDVEDIISSHSDVEYVAVIGIPDRDLGEKVCAFIKSVEGKTLTEEDIISHMQAHGAQKALIPANTQFVDHIPLTAAGKADKKVLRKIMTDQLS